MSSDFYLVLTNDQIKSFSEYGTPVNMLQGDFLIRKGVGNHGFFIVLKGCLSVLNERMDELFQHGEGEFTGDTDAISSRVSTFNVQAKTNVELLHITHENLKLLLLKNYELSTLMIKTFMARRLYEGESNAGNITLLGSKYCQSTFEIRSFLSKNHVNFAWEEINSDPPSIDLLASLNLSMDQLPVVLATLDKILIKPTIQKLAQELGLSEIDHSQVYDLVIVGAGPAGLASSVYASSEGLKVVTIDAIGPGGQAGTSSKIENYLGFPTGISGGDLARNAFIQAQKFGCSITVSHSAQSIFYNNNIFEIQLDSGKSILGRAVIAATGARYRKLNLANLENFEGKGVYYGATAMEAQTLQGKDIIIVGGGNSAGQAAIFLSEKSTNVYLVIRGDDLGKSMSDYLVSRLYNSSRIHIILNSEIIKLEGEFWLTKVFLRNRITLKETSYEVSDLFVFLGADPCTDWLKGSTCLDDKGFILTGRDISREMLESFGWPSTNNPQSLETCLPGLFAVGDSRYGSIKRVASAVGEGAMAVSQVHSFLSR